MIAPLRKCKLDGKLYTRRPEVEDKIIELALLSRYELIIQCAIRQKDDPGYVPSECLMYFVRECRTNRPDTYFQKLYKLLIERAGMSGKLVLSEFTINAINKFKAKA